VVSSDKTPDYGAVVARLDRFREVPTEALAGLVVGNGVCFAQLWPPQEPDWDDAAPSDRDLAARLCAGCPVIDACLELDLRTTGQDTRGVWGGLPEDDRRALHPAWLARRQPPDRQDGTRDEEGGPQP
jgi:WhiB family redox-sensing transcriptional regulator